MLDSVSKTSIISRVYVASSMPSAEWVTQSRLVSIPRKPLARAAFLFVKLMIETDVICLYGTVPVVLTRMRGEDLSPLLRAFLRGLNCNLLVIYASPYFAALPF